MSRLKQMGLTAGYPDLMLCIPKAIDGWWMSGLFIEMKSPKGRPTAQQLEIHNKLKERGYVVKIAYGFDEAKECIEKYLS
jgi:hypothetical protein